MENRGFGFRFGLTPRVEEVTMQPSRQQYGGIPTQFTMPPPGMPLQPQSNMGTVQMMQQPKTSANTRLVRYTNKTDAALVVGSPGAIPNMYMPQATSPPPLADRKQYTVTDGRATCMLSQTLPPKTNHAVYVSHVEDGPYSFCLQLKSSVEEVLPKLKSILARHQVAAPMNAKLIPGAVVTARGSDDVLRRAVVMKLEPNTCHVYYVDFGNSEDRPYSDIFHLPNTAAELSPAMAMQFCLADLNNVKITDANKEYFARLLLGKQVLIRVTESTLPAFQFCELFWEGRSMREILINLNSPTQYRYHMTPSGDDTQVSVVYVEGPELFFVQYTAELENVNSIQEAVEAYCQEQPRITDKSSIFIGCPVAAIFPEDSRWYRGLVAGINDDKIRVFYVDYGNRTEVSLNQMCMLSPDLVTKWPAQAVTCCLVGFDAVSPPTFVVDKMEEAVLGCTFKLKLVSILSGLRLNVDLIDDQGNSIAEKMKALYNDKGKSTSTETPGQPTAESKKHTPNKSNQEDDRASQHSNDSSGGKKNKFQRPPLKADRDRYERTNKFEQRSERSTYEEKSTISYGHDDRAENSYQHKTDTRSDWKKGSKKPYMDQVEEWGARDKSTWGDKPKTDTWGDKSGDSGGFKKSDWRNHSNETSADKPGWRSDNSRGGERHDKGGWNNNKYERKPIPNRANDENKNGDWGSKERQFGANKFAERDSRFGDRPNKFGDRENKFGDREKKFGERGSKPGWRSDSSRGGERYDKGGWNNSNSTGSAGVKGSDEVWDDEPAASPVLSAVISEYPHQPVVAGQEYKVLFAGMDAPNDVYVHMANSDPVLEKIRNLIDADTAAPSRPISSPVLAMPVLARFDEDQLLYRALIKSVAKIGNGQVDVFFVDYGNSAVVSLKEVFTIPSELVEIPIQAIHVIVTDMPALPNVDLDACQAHFNVEEGLTLKPTSTTAVNMVQCVQGTLVLPDGKSVAQAIRDDPLCTGTQSSSAVPDPTPSSDEEKVKTPEIVTWIERLDLLVGQTINAKIVKKLDSDLYCVQATGCLGLVAPAQSEDPLTSEITAGKDVIVHVKSLSQDRLLVKFYDSTGKSLSSGQNINRVCPLPIFKRKGTCVVCNTEDDFIYLQSEDSGEPLVVLLNDMYAYYANNETPKNIFKAGDICAAESLLDGNWYRAKVEIASDTYTVRYVDYGNTEEVGFDNLRILAPEFTSPELCLRVALPLKYKDRDACLNSMGQGPFEVTFIKKDLDRDCWYVDICDSAQENLACKWIKEKKAEGITTIPADIRLRDPGWNLKKGDSIPVVVSHIDSPDVFWVQLSDYLTDIDALQSKLQELPADGGELGDIFVAKYADDGLWYRAIHCGDDVRFIDYGNTDPAQERKKLPADLIYPLKGYAFPVRLCVKPVGAEWTTEAKDAFDAFIDRDVDDFKRAEIISVDFETVVDLKCGNDLLSTVLISGSHAISFGIKVEKQSSEMVETEAPKDNSDSDVGRPSVAVVDGSSRLPVVDEVPQQAVGGVVTSATSIDDFYIQLDTKADAIDQMADRLSAADSYEEVEDPAIGDYLLAKFPEDEAWYRATVLSKEPLEVLFVDYGNVSPANEFRKLPSDLAALPLLAWHCSAGTVDEAINKKFMDFVDECTSFEVTFTGVRDGKQSVQLSVDGQSITASPEKTEPDSVASSKADVSVSDTIPAQVPPSTSAETCAKDGSKDSETLPLRSEPLKKGLYKRSIVVHCNGPYDFFVQTDDVQIQVEEVSNALFDGNVLPKLDSVKKGDFVVAQFAEDDAYYRATVLEDDPILVFFTDYGNTTPATVFHEMPAVLATIPPLAVRCSLHSPQGGWNADAIDQFPSLVENSECRSVDLDVLTPGDPNIVDILIDGSSVTQKLAPDAKFPNSNQDIPEANEPVTDAENADRPEDPENTRNEEFTITVSYATSPSEFYFQKDDKKVSDLAARLVTSEEFKPIEKCEVGQLICAKYFEDELWYRAKVISVDPVNVLFVDYGNVSDVKEMRELPEDLSALPPLAVKASLLPQEQAWTDEETDKFCDVVYSGEMKCAIIEEKSDLTIVRLNYQNGDMITFLGRPCSGRSSSSEYLTPGGSTVSVESSSIASELLSSVAEALKSNRELQETLDARLASEDLLLPCLILPEEEQGCRTDDNNGGLPGSSATPVGDIPDQSAKDIDLDLSSDVPIGTNDVPPADDASFGSQSTLSAVFSVELDDTVIVPHEHEFTQGSICSVETPEKCIPSQESFPPSMNETLEDSEVLIVEPDYLEQSRLEICSPNQNAKQNVTPKSDSQLEDEKNLQSETPEKSISSKAESLSPCLPSTPENPILEPELGDCSSYEKDSLNVDLLGPNFNGNESSSKSENPVNVLIQTPIENSTNDEPIVIDLTRTSDSEENQSEAVTEDLTKTLDPRKKDGETIVDDNSRTPEAEKADCQSVIQDIADASFVTIDATAEASELDIADNSLQSSFVTLDETAGPLTSAEESLLHVNSSTMNVDVGVGSELGADDFTNSNQSSADNILESGASAYFKPFTLGIVMQEMVSSPSSSEVSPEVTIDEVASTDPPCAKKASKHESNQQVGRITPVTEYVVPVVPSESQPSGASTVISEDTFPLSKRSGEIQSTVSKVDVPQSMDPSEPQSCSSLPSPGVTQEQDKLMKSSDEPSTVEDSKLEAETVPESSTVSKSSGTPPTTPEVAVEPTMDIVKKTTPKPSTSAAGLPKKPVKSVAEIKAQAKSKIFGPSGLPSVAKRATPSPTSSPRATKSRATPQPTSPYYKDDKIIPGCVLGNQ